MAQELQDKLTPCTAQEMLDALYVAWVRYFGAPPDNTDALRILLAQWALETGWGKACHNWNIGNVKAAAGGVYNWQYFRCNEVLNGKIVWFDPPNPGCCFRAFSTIEDGVLDHLRLLVQHKTFSLAWPAVITGDPVRYAHVLKMAGYYTADEATYAHNVASLFRTFQKLVPSVSEPMPLVAGIAELSIYSQQDDILRWERRTDNEE